MTASASGFDPSEDVEYILHSHAHSATAPARAERLLAEYERLRKIEEAARAYLAVPRTVAKDPDGVIHMDFTPQLEARKTLATALAGVETKAEEQQ